MSMMPAACSAMGEALVRGRAAACGRLRAAAPSASVEAADSPSSSALVKRQVDLLSLVGKLKVTKRAGWVQRGIPDCESVADHMYRMAVMSLVLPVAGVDFNRCLQLAVVHDMAEAIVGDITPQDGVPKAEKNRLETAAIEHITGMLGGAKEGARLRQLWQEYEDGVTPEATLVKDYDKLEMILQAAEYEGERGASLGEFFDSVRGRLSTQLAHDLAAEIEGRRPPPGGPSAHPGGE